MDYTLIELIKSNPILYDNKYRLPRYQDEKFEKWNEIGSKLKRDPSTIRVRWKTLRDTYLKERQRKMNENQKHESERSNYTWKYYDHLHFLNNEIKEPLVTICKEESDEEYSQYIENEPEANNVNEIEFEIEKFDLNDYIQKIDNNVVVTGGRKRTASCTENSNKKIKIDKDFIINEACQELSTMLKNAKQRFTSPSANQMFFNSVALQVEEAKLSPIDLMRLQQRVLEVMTQELLLYQDRIYET